MMLVRRKSDILGWGAALLLSIAPSFGAETQPEVSPEQIAALIRQLDGGDMESRVRAKKAMQQIVTIGKPAVPALIEATRHESQWVRVWAAGALGEIGDARAIPSLLHLLNDPAEEVRMVATWHISRFAAEDASIPPAVAQRMADPNENVRKWAKRAIIEKRFKNVLPILESFLRNPDPDVRADVFPLVALLRGEKIPNAIKSTLQMEKDPLLRAAAYGAIARSLPPDNEAASRLLEALAESDAEVLLEAVRGLEWVLKEGGEKLSSEARESVCTRLRERLPSLISHENARLRAHALYLLSGLEREKLLPKILMAFEDPAPVMRIAALKAIARAGVKNRTTLQAVIGRLSDDDPQVRFWAHRALLWTVPQAKNLPFDPYAQATTRTEQIERIKSSFLAAEPAE